MNLHHLRTLVAIADTGSFGAAADSLFITASAVSHQVREMEEALGVTLFDRATRPPRLNAHGRTVVARGRDVLLRFDTWVEAARTPGEISGRLMLGCVSGVSSELIPVALANLRTTHPAVQVRMVEGLSGPLSNRVRRRELDAAIITELPDPEPELQSLAITEEALVVVAPAGSRAAGWRDVLESQPFLRLNRTTGMGTVIDRTLRAAGVTVQEAMELDSSEVIVGMANAGLGAGVVPAGRLQHVAADAVTAMPFGDPPIFRRVVLTERRNNPRSDLSRVVYAELKRLTLASASKNQAA